ncbi:hypothetical protein OA955_02125 [Candidatus Marinimicrobia bacterium]|nr:hypothetical protein [Candidatus Neomarinimicrobiota bacterium]
MDTKKDENILVFFCSNMDILISLTPLTHQRMSNYVNFFGG